MTRAERMFVLSDLLRAKGATTVRELARELDVHERTVRRDLSLLREQGMLITAEPGPGGGIRLERPQRSSVVLSTDEAVALWMLVQLSRVATHLPWGDAARSGVSKLLAGLPTERSKELRALSKRVAVGKPASETVRLGAGPPTAELLGYFEQAFREGYGLGFQYRDRNGEESRRRIEPHGLLVESPVWYILARDVDKQAPRMFRMDRITRPRILKDVRFRPDGEVIRELTQHLAC